MTMISQAISTVKLHPDQMKAITAGEGTTVVFAGPGSGKTTVLTQRVCTLLERGISPEQILVVTFTRAAAGEMQHRITTLTNKTRGLILGTFHSIFLRLFRQKGVSIPHLLNDREQRMWIRELLNEKEQPSDEEGVATTLSQIGFCKGNMVLPERMKVKKQQNQLFRDLFQAYEKKKEAQNVWDYDDILLAFCGWLKEEHNPLRGSFSHILVDEFQDINRVQYESLKLLLADEGSLFAVGDDDQSIYGFRGSDPRFMQELNRRPKSRQVVLSVNHRSTDVIVAAGQELIRHNRMRQEKKLIGTGQTGKKPDLLQPIDEEEEAAKIIASLDDSVKTAVLYRTSTQARAVIDALVRKGIPFAASMGDALFYRRWQIKDLFAYLSLVENPNDLDSLVRIMNKPKRYLFGEEWIDAVWNQSQTMRGSLLDALPEIPGIETYQKKYLSQLKKQVTSLQGLGVGEAIQRIRQDIGYDRFLTAYAKDLGQEVMSLMEPVEELAVAARSFQGIQELLDHANRVEEALRKPASHPRIHLMTLHRAKGLEFDRVFLIGLHAMTIPHRRSIQVAEHRKNAAWEEERRLLYVGMTRAKQELLLSVSRTRQGRRVGPSPFLKEMGFGEEVPAKEETFSPKWNAQRINHQGSKEQPQLQYAGEVLTIGSKVSHQRWGEGEVIAVETLTGSTPGRKVALRFQQETISLHYELSRQLGLIKVPSK
ncbi:ATP-dependent helicase [Marininema halotolerans]|uniref:DNA 3'-5' helicase n=1 Tax=Marininema halotolerans TaxID=1155944 RepID=A0A1I6TRA8_9BACL|nr:ATP-dependent helicase [Marininema halotolerans]SFS91725.1 DNA helicase-2 / ATP-dependent DNA helicase PcrA [Marininema halotolerans]